MPDTIRPSVDQMLAMLDGAYNNLLQEGDQTNDERLRLLGVLDDFRWYAGRLGAARIEQAPRPGRWSFAANLWHIVEQAVADAESSQRDLLVYYIDHGKEHVGQAAEIVALFNYDS